jgi:SAM-dependent methyltransferase
MVDVRCKLCQRPVYQQYAIKTKEGEVYKTNNWIFCSCGCLFNTEPQDKKKVFNEVYRKEYEEKKGIKERFNYYLRNYLPIVAEKTYGRKFLDVGFCLDYNIRTMREYGWLATGIDIIPNNYITGDFETYDFDGERFDFIMMADVLQCFDNPVEAIYKAYNLLNPTGLLFICTPDTDLIRDDFVPNWGHWNIKGNQQYVNKKILLDILNRVDRDLSGRFKVIFCDNDISKRFITWNTIHILTRKEKIELWPKK